MKELFSKNMAPLMGILMFGHVSWAAVPTETKGGEGARIMRDAKSLIMKNWQENGLEIQIDVLKKIETLDVPTGDVQWNIQWNGAKPFSGLLSLPVVFTQNGQVIKRVMLALKTRLYRNVLVPVKSIERHSLLRKEEFVVTKSEVALDGDHYVDETVSLENKRALRRLPAKSPVLESYIEETPLVKKGDHVSVIHHIGAIEISTKGVAKMDGHGGDHILVANLQSGKTMSALVMKNGQLEVSQDWDTK